MTLDGSPPLSEPQFPLPPSEVVGLLKVDPAFAAKGPRF